MQQRGCLINKLLGVLCGAGLLVGLSALSWPAAFTVTGSGDSGAGTLRQAILDANSNPGADTIQFNIPGAGPHTIQPLSALPTVTSAVVIDGWSQGGVGYTGPPLIELDGSSAGSGVHGLNISASSAVTVRGLVINRFGGSGIYISRYSGHAVYGCYLGTDVGGTAALGNGGDGIFLYNSTSNTVGGTTASARNVISGNLRNGIQIDGYLFGATGNLIQGNYIGTDVNGTSGLGNADHGVDIYYGDGNTVGGSAAGAGNVISGNDLSGINVLLGDGNIFEGNYCGTNSSGTAAVANQWYGVAIIGVNNRVGGTNAGAGNLVSGNRMAGIQVGGFNSTGNQVLGNTVGLDVNGTSTIYNRFDGIEVSCDGNTVGGTTPGARNISSGNWGYGMRIHGENNQVLGNYVGTDVNGTAARGNSQGGIILQGVGNTIGGTDPAAGNLISGNNLHGLYIAGSGTTNNQVLGNYIGTDVNGTADLGNTTDGISVGEPSDGNIIGGSASGAGNVISGNDNSGIYLEADNIQVLGNYIGTDAGGSANLGNSQYGIYMYNYASYNQIGGSADGEANVIAYNGLDGVYVYFQGDHNLISGNSIFANSGLGIDLYPNNVNANDTGDGDTGANRRQNYPVIDRVIRHASSTEIQGSLNSTANTTFTLEFFDSSSLDPSGNGEGETYIGAAAVTTDGSGDVSFNVTLPTTVPGNHFITATATDPNNNTSEFSGGRETPTLAVITAFQAYPGDRQAGAVVQWQTASEIGSAGFSLWRKDEDNETFQPVQGQFLPALVHEPAGGIYRLLDPAVSSGQTPTYQLIEIEADGQTREHGPFKVKVTAGPDPRLPAMTGPYRRDPLPPSPARRARLEAGKPALRQGRSAAARGFKGRGKITIGRRDLYHLDTVTIADVLGTTPHQAAVMIRANQLRLENRGRPIAWLPAPTGGIYFYGEGLDTPYTTENIYWLEKGKGVLMDVVDGGLPSPAVIEQTFTDTRHFEEDRYALTALYEDPEADFWLWEGITAQEAVKTFDLNLQGVAGSGSAAATLTVYLKGASDTGANPDHQVEVCLNGTPIGESRWDGTAGHHFSMQFDQSLLQEGQNSVAVAGKLSGGAAYSIFYVDAFDLSYRRDYRAAAGRLICRSEDSGVITISGFQTPHIQVFDITEPQRPRLVSGTRLDVVGGSFRVSFRPESPGRTYLAATADGVQPPAAIAARKPPTLKKKQNSADYLIIIPTGFEAAADELANLRQAEGLETMVVLLEDIYDAFHDGIASPQAIRSFLRYAHQNWRRRPQYVVLAGNGNYDYRECLGLGENLIPPLMAATPYGLFATDNLYGDVEGSRGVPEIAVGRLPVLNPQEFQAYVEKLRCYRSAGGEWTGRAMLLADDPDRNGDFPADSDHLAGFLSAYTLHKVYLPDFPTVNEARHQVLKGFNRGALLVNYLGHAGLDRLTAEGLLTTDDAAGLHNGDRMPLLTAFSCVVGRFSIPGADSLCESLLLKQEGGVIAAWAPSGAALHSRSMRLAAAFLQTVFDRGEKTLGTAIRQAQKEYAAAPGADPYILHLYNLLGDPALTIK
jgi:hypothetical protein